MFERHWRVPGGPVDGKKARTLTTKFKTTILYEAVPWYDGWHLKIETRYKKNASGGIGYEVSGPYESELDAWIDAARVRLETQYREARERAEGRS